MKTNKINIILFSIISMIIIFNTSSSTNTCYALEPNTKDLVKYDGNIEHIFFHSLIVYPELAFDTKGHSADGYNEWYVTVTEFKRILPLLKERGFILVNTDDVLTLDENRKLVRKDLYLPKGKKPLIISQDDVNYYKFMDQDGFTKRLVLDKNNEVSTLVKNPTSNQYSISRDGDLVPILDDYIKNNPDFSYQGAKGILGVTGYEGVFGYDIEDNSNLEQLTKITTRLMENGWEIASHSYTHNGKGFFGDNPIYNKLVYDFDKWDRKIRPIIGDTNIFISPYGITLDGENFKLVKKHGFSIYCCVDRNSCLSIKDNTIIMPRFNIDGFTMNKCREDINKKFFDVDKVIDGNRPKLK
ncbi:MAG: hypothetical protein RRZ84_06380 [Romboutsia sp.]